MAKTRLTAQVWRTINTALALLEADDLEEQASFDGVSATELERRITQARRAVWDRLEEKD